MGHGGDIKYDQTPSAVCVVLCPFVALCVVGVEIVSFFAKLFPLVVFSKSCPHYNFNFCKTWCGCGA